MKNAGHVAIGAAWAAGVFALYGPAAARQDAAAPAAAPAVTAATSPYKAEAGPHTVERREATWRDEARQRDVPVRIYAPQTDEPDNAAAERFPVIIFSHGLGGSREGYAYFAEHMAGQGYIVILPTHAGSDRAAALEWARARRGDDAEIDERAENAGIRLRDLGPWIKDGTGKPENLRNRPQDISFIIDQFEHDEALAAIVDSERIGVGGHSFGAYTAMAVGGMLVDLPDGEDTSFQDPRVKAVLAMSPQGAGTMGIDRDAWAGVEPPVMFLTGTRDYGSGNRSAAWRREAFDRMNGHDACLAILQDATHMTFGGRGQRAGARRGDATVSNERHLEIIRSLSTAFFNAHLRDDAAALSWLHRYMAAEHADCTTERHATGAAAGPTLTITVDAAAAPDLTAWGEKAKALCEEWHPIIAAELATEGFTAPTEITIHFREQMRAPAAAGGGVIHVNAGYVHDHLDDLGMIAHELTHLIQSYPNHPKRTPGWIVEGIADYIRFYKYEPGADRSRIDPERSNYDDSYRTTARFLDYLVRTRDAEVVRKLNAAARAGECDEAKIAEIFGRDPAELWEAFLAAEIVKPGT